MASGDFVFSFEESGSLSYLASSSSSVSFNTSSSVFVEENVGGPATKKDFVKRKKDSQSSFKTGSKARRKVASKQNQKKRLGVTDPSSLPALSDKKLEKITIKELNHYIQGIPKCQAEKIKKRRRILKNRKYALKCRLKCIQRKAKMAEENTSLEKEISATKEELQRILKQRDYYKAKYLLLQTDLQSVFFNVQPCDRSDDLLQISE